MSKSSSISFARCLFVIPVAFAIAGLLSGSADAASGNVSTYQNGDFLYLTGDSQDNVISLSRDQTGQLLVIGAEGTRVGNYRGKGFNNVNDVVIHMGEGSDRVTVKSDLRSIYVMSETTFLLDTDFEDDVCVYSDGAVVADCMIDGDLCIESATGYTANGAFLDSGISVRIEQSTVSGNTSIEGTNDYDQLHLSESTFDDFYANLRGDIDKVSLVAMGDDLVFGKLTMLLGGGYDRITYAVGSWQSAVPTQEIIAIDPNSYVMGGDKYWDTSAAKIEFNTFYSWTADFGVPSIGSLFGVNTGAITPTGRLSQTSNYASYAQDVSKWQQ